MRDVSNRIENLNGDNYTIDNSVTVESKLNEIVFKSEEIGADSFKKYEKKIKVISLLESVLGLIIVIVNFLNLQFTEKTINFTIAMMFGIGIFLIVLGGFQFWKYVLTLRKKKKVMFDVGRWNEVHGDQVIKYQLQSECVLCGGTLIIRKAKIWRTEEVFDIEYIAICQNSNKNTRHYYNYDTITKTGKLMDSDRAKEYTLID